MTDTIVKMEELANISAAYIEKVIAGEVEASGQALQVARLASQAISNYTRHLSVKHNHERTILRLADKLSSDPGEMIRYIQVALPDATFVRALLPDKVAANA